MKSKELILEWALAKALLNVGVEKSNGYVEFLYPAKRGLQGYNSVRRISDLEFEKGVPILSREDVIHVEKQNVRTVIERHYDSLGEKYIKIYGDTKMLNPNFREVLMSHAFAYSFFGPHRLEVEFKLKDVNDTLREYMKCEDIWQYHLQRMVLEADPVDYLRQFVPNPNQKKLELDEN